MKSVSILHNQSLFEAMVLNNFCAKIWLLVVSFIKLSSELDFQAVSSHNWKKNCFDVCTIFHLQTKMSIQNDNNVRTRAAIYSWA